VRRVQAGPVVGFVSVVALLGLLALAVGLGGAGWATGVACGMFVNGALARGLAHHGSDGLGPAGRVTLTRAVLVCGVAALTADSFSRSTPVAVLVARQQSGPPAIVCFLPAFWLLVPGALGLVGVASVLGGDSGGVSSLVTTVSTMVAIALGVLAGTAITGRLRSGPGAI